MTPCKKASEEMIQSAAAAAAACTYATLKTSEEKDVWVEIIPFRDLHFPHVRIIANEME